MQSRTHAASAQRAAGAQDTGRRRATRPGDPAHIAVVMDGNGRWARQRGLPRNAGHRAGVKAARGIVELCAQRGIACLTLFAFSSENWSRPQDEVGLLMRLFVEALQREVDDLHRNDVRVRFIGDRGRLAGSLRERIVQAEQLTAGNRGLELTIAVSYGGRWDIAQAARALAQEVREGRLNPEQIDESRLAEHMALAGLPDPDLFIRTGGEARISNFLLWNLAYTEMFFSDLLWPDFDVAALDQALHSFAARQRRFGRVAAQLEHG